MAHLACANWPEGATKVVVYAATGQRVLSKPLLIRGRLAELDARQASLPAGLYRIVVQGTERTISSAWHVE